MFSFPVILEMTRFPLFSPYQHQQQVLGAIERAKQVTAPELNSIIRVRLVWVRRDTTPCLWPLGQSWAGESWPGAVPGMLGAGCSTGSTAALLG